MLTLIVIANCLDSTGQNGFATIARLASETRLSTRQVKRLVSLLEASGELRVRRSSGRWANRFSLPQMIHNSDKLSPSIRTSNSDNMTPLNPGAHKSNRDSSRTNGGIAMTPDQSIETSIDHKKDLLRSAGKMTSLPDRDERFNQGWSINCRICHKDHIDALTTIAVQMYRDQFALTPNEGFRHDIMVTAKNLSLWKRVLNGWSYTKKGKQVNKNPMAVKAMLDEYERLEQL